MKNKKTKIVITALICTLIISVGSFAVMASSGDRTSEDNNLFNAAQSTFKKVSDQVNNFIENFRGPKSIGFGFKLFDPEETASILGITKEEFQSKLEEADGNIIKILEDAGKLDEYKAKVLEDYKAMLDEAVATDGKLTQEKADELYAKTEEMVNNFSSENGGFGIKMPGFDGGRGPRTKRFNSDDGQVTIENPDMFSPFTSSNPSNSDGNQESL